MSDANRQTELAASLFSHSQARICNMLIGLSVQIWTLPQVEWFAIAPHVSWTTQHYFNLMGIKKTIRW